MKNSQSGRINVSLLIVLIIIVLVGLVVFIGTRRKTPQGQVPVTDATETVSVPAAQLGHDGLGRADATTRYPLDEFGAGIASRDVFMRDINGDGIADRITRTRVENGTDHYYDDYKLELRVGDSWQDITPADFRTIESAECALQRFVFVFDPTFQVIKISRPWRDSWTTPTMATRTVYRLGGAHLRAGEAKPLKEICNVADLF